MTERTLVLIKPDAIKRGLVGEIIARFEKAGLTIDDMKMLRPAKEIVEKHYTDDESWLRTIGKKTIDTYKKYNLNLTKDLGTADALEIGKIIRKWLIQYITSGSVIAIIINGNHAVEIVRKIVGGTVPLFTELGSIRGDFSIDSPDFSTREKRVLQNLIHASGTQEEAEEEIALWF